MDVIWHPRDIELKSMKMIEEHLQNYNFTPLEKAVAKRVIHATADTALIDKLIFNLKLKGDLDSCFLGNRIFTDVNMLKEGISKKFLEKYQAETICHINNPSVISLAKEKGITRAAASIYYAGDALEGAVVAVGNAPTALFALLDIVDKKIARPTLIIGMPVGFVGAAEAKELLAQRQDLNYVTLEGKRGGSPLAAAAINALMIFAGKDS